MFSYVSPEQRVPAKHPADKADELLLGASVDHLDVTLDAARLDGAKEVAGDGAEHTSAVTCPPHPPHIASDCPAELHGTAQSPVRPAGTPSARQNAERPTLETCMIRGLQSLSSSAAKICARLNSRDRCRPLERNSSTIRWNCLLRFSSVCRMPDAAMSPRYACFTCSSLRTTPLQCNDLMTVAGLVKRMQEPQCAQVVACVGCWFYTARDRP